MHIQLVAGKAQACQVYPDKLCRATLSGIRLEIANSGVIKIDSRDLTLVSQENHDAEEYVKTCMDDMSGQALDTKLVRETRVDEMDKFAEHNVYRNVSESKETT